MKQATSRQLYAYWNELRGERAAPARGEIDPGDIRHILADVFMLEFDAAGTARFRLAGTRCCAIFGRELRGSSFDQLWPDETRDEVRSMLDTVLDEPAGVAAGLRATPQGGLPVDMEMLILPLRYQGKTHARVIGALSPCPPLDWIGMRPIGRLEITSTRIMRPAGPHGQPVRGEEPVIEARQRFVVHEGGRA